MLSFCLNVIPGKASEPCMKEGRALLLIGFGVWERVKPVPYSGMKFGVLFVATIYMPWWDFQGDFLCHYTPKNSIKCYYFVSQLV